MGPMVTDHIRRPAHPPLSEPLLPSRIDVGVDALLSHKFTTQSPGTVELKDQVAWDRAA